MILTKEKLEKELSEGRDLLYIRKKYKLSIPNMNTLIKRFNTKKKPKERMQVSKFAFRSGYEDEDKKYAKYPIDCYAIDNVYTKASGVLPSRPLAEYETGLSTEII